MKMSSPGNDCEWIHRPLRAFRVDALIDPDFVTTSTHAVVSRD